MYQFMKRLFLAELGPKEAEQICGYPASPANPATTPQTPQTKATRHIGQKSPSAGGGGGCSWEEQKGGWNRGRGLFWGTTIGNNNMGGNKGSCCPNRGNNNPPPPTPLSKGYGRGSRCMVSTSKLHVCKSCPALLLTDLAKSF